MKLHEIVLGKMYLGKPAPSGARHPRLIVYQYGLHVKWRRVVNGKPTGKVKKCLRAVFAKWADELVPDAPPAPPAVTASDIGAGPEDFGGEDFPSINPL